MATRKKSAKTAMDAFLGKRLQKHDPASAMLQEEERRRKRNEQAELRDCVKRMLAATNRGHRHKKSYRDIVNFLRGLPEKIEPKVFFGGDGFLLNDCTDETDPEFLSATHIVLCRYFVVKIFGWEFKYDESVDDWSWKGVVFPRNDERRYNVVNELRNALYMFVELDSGACDPPITKQLVFEALAVYRSRHGDGCEDVFYMRDENGPLYLRPYEYDCEEEYFADLMPITLDEAVDQFFNGECMVYEPYDE